MFSAPPDKFRTVFDISGHIVDILFLWAVQRFAHYNTRVRGQWNSPKFQNHYTHERIIFTDADSCEHKARKLQAVTAAAHAGRAVPEAPEVMIKGKVELNA